jgi:osmotically-inducible protein OsmY
VSQRKLSKVGGRRQRRERRPAARPVSWHAKDAMGGALLTLLALTAPAAGCGRGRQGAVAGGARRDAGRAMKEVEVKEDPVKTGIEAADAGLAGKVRSRLDGDAQLRRLPIEVDAEAGRVTLWGHVTSAEERAAAEQLARGTPGVTSVIDHIKIGL